VPTVELSSNAIGYIVLAPIEGGCAEFEGQDTIPGVSLSVVRNTNEHPENHLLMRISVLVEFGTLPKENGEKVKERKYKVITKKV